MEAGISLTAISALAELERIGWAYEPAGGDEIKCRCPAHADSSPSCTMNITKRVWKCHAANCGASGDIVTFISLVLSRAGKTTITRATVWDDLCTRYGMTSDKTVDASVIEKHHEAIWSAGPLLAELRARGISDDAIRKYRLGYDNGRISIPVYNVAGQCVNIRKYLPGAPGAEKMKNLRGHGAPRLYPIGQLAFDKIIVCGGEMKAVATADRMNPYGYGAVTITAGEGEGWNAEHLKQFKGKTVYICMDVDDAGRKAATWLCGIMMPHASWVGDFKLDLDRDVFPKGDINNYWGDLKKTPDELIEALKKVERWTITLSKESETTPVSEAIPVHLGESTNSKYTGRRVKLRATVSAMDTTPYLVPGVIKCYCAKGQAFCQQCPVFPEPQDSNGAVMLTASPESPAILSMVKSAKKAQNSHIREALRMPACKAVTFKIAEYYNVEDVRLVPQLEITSRAADQVMQPCYYIGKGLESNCSYDFEGRVFPHPGTQQAIILASKSSPAEDALTTYKPTDAELRDLAVFQCAHDVDAIRARMSEVYDDLAANVTRIYKRQALHLTIDLAYHSVLLLKIDERLIKGWAEVLIAGDSSQGKSEATMGLMRHYGLGEKVDCKNATAAGLLGGLQQLGNRWFVTWGIIPQHDKRIVVLEELKGAATEIIGKLTDMRSSGVAEIPRIEKRRAHARTRLIALSNPRGDRPLSKYNFGIEAIVELIGGLEDIRRFDFATLVASSQVDAAEINRFQRDAPKVPHRFTSLLCRRLLLWAWTRTPEQVVLPPETMSRIIDRAIKLCETYSEAVPLVDRGSMRHKLARLSTALACRLFSHVVGDPTSVYVSPAHVDYVADFIDETYSNNVFGYKDYSDAVKMADSILEPDAITARILATPFPKDFIEQILYTREIEPRDLSDWCGWDKEDAIGLLSFLVRKHALQRDGRSYRKTSAFIEHLKALLTSNKLKAAEAPSFAREVENPY